MKCPHSELTLVVDQAFDIYEKTHVACAACGKRATQIQKTTQQKLFLKIFGIGISIFFAISYLTTWTINELLKSIFNT